jgi:Cft2 family RNA processing exonuclease
VLLQDSKKRADRDKQEGKEPQFAPEEIDTALHYLKRMKEVQWRKPEQICDDVTAEWIPAGHILGAAMIHIKGKRESILMTGDVSDTGQKTIPGMSDLLYQPDVMVMESTYGDRQHKDRAEEEERLISEVKGVIEAGGKVLIPVFAIGRAQEVILILKQAIQRGKIECPVWVDGMARDVNDIYSDFPDELLSSLQRKAKRGENIFYSADIKPVPQDFNRDEVSSWDPCCIVASSGMLNGGRSMGYFKQLAGNPENLIAMTGYQAEGNPGHTLLGLKKKEPEDRALKLNDGTCVSVSCKVERYSLSAHADRDQLTGLVEKVQPRKLLLVHGDPDARKKLSQSIRKTYPAVDVGLPKNGSTYTMEKRTGIAEGRQLWHDRMVAELYASVSEKGLKGPFSIRELTEMWFGTEATTLTAVSFFLWCLSLDSQFFERRSGDWFYPRQPA